MDDKDTSINFCYSMLDIYTQSITALLLQLNEKQRKDFDILFAEALAQQEVSLSSCLPTEFKDSVSSRVEIDLERVSSLSL